MQVSPADLIRRIHREPMRLLLVDDDPGIRELLRVTFEAVDVDLDEAADADSALDALLHHRPDAIVLDVTMPGTDGLELAASIRKTHPGIPVAVVSANVQDEIIGRARELNAGFIPKPLTDDALGAFLSGAALRLKKAVT